MDPKKLNHLDPKLKEVYERVMGTSVAQPGQTQPSAAPTAVTPPPVATPAAPPTATPPPVTNPVMTMPPMMKKGGLPPAVFIGVGIVVFFLIYSVFWMWFFKIPLPFNFF